MSIHINDLVTPLLAITGHGKHPKPEPKVIHQGFWQIEYCRGTIRVLNCLENFMVTQYLSLAQKICKANFTRLPFPYKLTYAITYQCNYRCKTCNIWQRSSTNELTFHEIRAFFKTSHQFSWIHLTGGEIFLRKDVLDIVDVIMTECSRLLLINFPTNGFMTDRIVSTVAKIAAFR